MEPYAPYPLNHVRDWLHRRRWPIRIALAVLLVPCGLWWSHTRWTTMPPRDGLPWDMDAGLTCPPPEVDRSEDLVAAIKRLPPAPTVTVPTTSPAGMNWYPWEAIQYWETPADQRTWNPNYQSAPGTVLTVHFSNALEGEWRPQQRLQLGKIVRYLETPATRDALEDIRTLSGEPYCLRWHTFGGRSAMGKVRDVSRILTARVRYHMAQEGDFASAARDAQTLIQLCRGVEDDAQLIRALTAMACRSLVLSELMHLSRDFRLTRYQTDAFIAWMESHRYHARQVFQEAMTGEQAEVSPLLDCYFTASGSGDGWFVPVRRDADHGLLQSQNLLSVFYDDRQAIHRKLTALYEGLAEASRQPYREATDTFEALDESITIPTIPSEIMWSPSRCLFLCLRTRAEHDATIVALALSAYVTEHGNYPDQLAELVPIYMSALPLDPFSDKPLRYRLDDRDGYVLYSVGEDGRDDGGTNRDERGDRIPSQYHKDLFFVEPFDDGWRGEPYEEWVLLEVDSSGDTEE